MSIWKSSSSGKILVSDSGHFFTCDDCPCGACEIATTSFTVTIVGTPVTVFACSTDPWFGACGSFATIDGFSTTCYWCSAGTIGSGFLSDRLVLLYGTTTGTVSWTVHCLRANCTGAYIGNDDVLVGNGPAGTYTNTISVA